MNPAIEQRMKEAREERDRKVAALDPERAAMAHMFLDTLMAMASSPEDMIMVMFCVRSAFQSGVSLDEIASGISDLAAALEAEREGA